jgi:hypothetical protein
VTVGMDGPSVGVTLSCVRREALGRLFFCVDFVGRGVPILLVLFSFRFYEYHGEIIRHVTCNVTRVSACFHVV